MVNEVGYNYRRQVVVYLNFVRRYVFALQLNCVPNSEVIVVLCST